MAYFRTLTTDQQVKVIQQIGSLGFILFSGHTELEVPERFLPRSGWKENSSLRTSLRSVDFIERVTKYLEEKLASTSSIHGCPHGCFWSGVLILAKAASERSECALDLILRGHRLVADDMVHIQKRSLLGRSVVGRVGFEVHSTSYGRSGD